MKAEFNTTPAQYASLGQNQKQSQLHPRRRALMLPKEPDEVTEFQKELDSCMNKLEK